MGLVIEDGTGDGYKVRVDDQNRIRSYAVTEPELTHTSENDEDSYTWTAVSADIDAGDTALYVVNDSKTKDLHIQRIYVWADVVTQFKIHCPAYVTPAGTAVVGVNMNRKSGNTADATCKADETGNVFAAANVITTVSNSYDALNPSDDVATAAAGEGQWIEYDGALILGYQDSVAVDIVADSAAFECTIVGYYHD